ncbi:receptor-type tyrosine-protein phosphatase beta-like isoform X2 [Eleutherodactylus coqui]|uniref:receptor-type tyrosine-protein phosphatase beta-like isoform X2 n=1 Tax=Eleutherodactylus coqui TaxID=57060 RepID=UPI003461EDD0
MGAGSPPVLLLIITALLLPKVVSSCDDLPECHRISVRVSASQITVTGLPEGFFLQNITDINGHVTRASDNSLNNTSGMVFVSGTQYVIHYGNGTTSCCRSVTTKPLSVTSLRTGHVTSYSASLTWSPPDEYQTSYSYRVQTNDSSSSTAMNDTIVTSQSATIVDLTPGETYTFTVYTRAADNITESDPVSYTTCTAPEKADSIVVTNNKTTDTLVVTWAKPVGKVDNYNVRLTGAVNSLTQTNTTQVTFTGLLPGREYNVTVQTVSGTCNQTSDPVTEATNPTQPGRLSFSTIATKNLTFSWLEPENMTDVNKSYNITYGIFSSTNVTVESPTTNATLQDLTSGANYSITVVTVGVRRYRSLPSSTSVYTKPMSVKSLQISNFTTSSVALTWSQPDEYKTSYSYRVQTSDRSSAITMNDTIVASESALIMDLTPGETYTFLVYTRAGDNITESDPVSISTCTVPGRANISLNNYGSVDTLEASWTKPAGKVDNYTVIVTGINNITRTNTTQVNITGLLPGREYNVAVQISSGHCSWTSDPVTEATYPTQPGKLSFSTIATKNLTFSWLEPENMTDVSKSYNISYGIFSSTNSSVESITTNATLQNLISGMNYSITVVTVGVREYRSLPVSTFVYTKPMSVKSLQISNFNTSSVVLTWSQPDEYKTSYSYRIRTKNSSSAITMNDTIVTNESALIMDLTPGETYTFMVYTRAADNITESDPVSVSTCTDPGQVSSVSLKKSVDSLEVTWKTPEGKVDHYTVILTGAVNNMTQTNTTQVTFTRLLPGREYNVTVQTISGNCNQTSDPVTEATDPTEPRNLTVSTIGTNGLTLSWEEPLNMDDVTKSYNISYGDPSGMWTVTNGTTVVLQNLTSGTNYSITVVTVGVRGYLSSPVSTSVFTKPMSVKSLLISNLTTSSVALTWSQPDEYKPSYSYRVRTSDGSSAITMNDTIVANESALIMDLTPGETYTFLVYTRAADNITESDPVSLSTCTVPGRANISLNNYGSVDTLEATWTKPAGKVDNYTVTVNGINNITQTNTTQVNITGLLPGREYNVTVQISSGHCRWTSDPVTEATYPTQPGTLFLNTTATKDLTLSWLEPVNMSDVKKSYNISYGIFPLTNLSAESLTTNVTLQSLISGTNYSITVVTIGVRKYQSLPVSTSVYTKPISIKSLQVSHVTSYSASLTWNKPDEYKTSYHYKVQTYDNSSTALINDTIVTSESATIMDLTPGETYTFTVYTRAADNLTVSDPVSYTTCTDPGQVSSVSLKKSVDSLEVTWKTPEGKVDHYTVILTGAVNNMTQTNTTQVTFTRLLPGREYNVTVQTISGNCNQTSDPVTEATNPTEPRNLTVSTIGTNSLTLSWEEPLNMDDVTKSYNISYGYPSGILTATSGTTVVLQNLTSGTNYSITVVTVGVRGYLSSPVSTSVFTKPMSVKSLQISNLTTSSVELTWSQPDEYKTSYSYRVQTKNSSSAITMNDTIVTNESATIMHLTPGETYTFMVYTRAADNITESDVALLTTCIAPEKIVNLQLTNNNTTDTLVVTWTKAAGKVENSNVSLTGAVSHMTQTNTTQVTFTGLLPGREYNVIVHTISGNCNQTSDPVTEATFPTPPGNLHFITIRTHSLTLSWSEPVDMSGVVKSYNISYGNSSGTWTVTSNTTNVTLQDLTSGTNYSITLLTIGVRRYPSLPVSTSVYTTPTSVKSLHGIDVTPSSVSLVWSQPDEYQTSYSYRVQTNDSSSSTSMNDTIVTSESATIMHLTPGETYTFTVYTRAGDNITESDPVSYITCTAPEKAVSIVVTNNNKTDTLVVTWAKPVGKVDHYTVILTGAVSNMAQTNTTKVTFTGLLPGREYNVTVHTVSGNCSQTSDPVTEATYPAPPTELTFSTIGTNNMMISWLEPVEMSGLKKSYHISYRNSSGMWTVTSNTTNVILQDLRSGTNYSITVVTVGVSGYQSSPASASAYTKPFSVKSLQFSHVTSYSASLTWSQPDEYQPSYSYRVQTNVTSSSIVKSNTIVTSESATIMDLTPGETYTYLVYTRAADNLTESDPVLVTNCTVPEAARGFICTCITNSSSLQFTWDCPEGIFTGFSFSATNKTSVHSDANSNICDAVQQSHIMQGLNFSTIYTVNMTTRSSCGKSSAVVQKQCSTCIGCNKLSESDLLKTYNDFRSRSADEYVAMIKYLDKTSQRSSPAVAHTVTIGDNSEDSSYYKNGPLEPASSYWVGIAGFTSLELDQAGRILPSRSLYSLAYYYGPMKTAQNVGMIAGAAIGSILGLLVIALTGVFIWRKRRKGEKKADVSLPTIKISQAMSTNIFSSHFEKLKADSNLGFSEEYEKLAPVGTEQSKSAAELPENRSKNRYTNVLPYDVSRVVLSSSGNYTEDYINANYIPGYNSSKEFIAAQGPLPKTVNDFWRMIWEKDVQVLIMLTKCAELGKVKCEEYWPERGTKTYGNLSISMTDEEILSDWTIRDFTLVHMQTRQSKQIRHFHFTAWPDFGVPKTTSDLIRFRNLVHEYTTNCYPLNSPIVVHCSAGVGRTGTFITLDRIIKQIEAEDRIDVYGTVYDLRMHRLLMVQTESQYIFLNQCALDIIKAQKETKPDLIYQNVSVIYQNVNDINGPPLKRTNL